ncbi:hypothetical protein AURDEDRAFT_144879 [Auricularia subglabra TFB-10046 SS5]|nr:hypothetical protein AURDEDRAFT_144879 [Auricularia subglabra TFB-10046 SS5]
MTTAFPPLSAAVTRILALSGFPAQLKTRDIQSAFNEWENVNGGFKIKWLDDTNLLMVFADAGVAKRAYLQALASPHPVFSSPTGGTKTTIKPYDGADAQTVIQAVNARPGGGGHRARASMSAAGPSAQPHARTMSMGFRPPQPAQGREPSPTLPSIPNQPTLNALISSSLADPAALSGSESSAPSEGERVAPKIGDPGRRMVGHHLGIRHPGLAHRAASSGGDNKSSDNNAAVSSVSD